MNDLTSQLLHGYATVTSKPISAATGAYFSFRCWLQASYCRCVHSLIQGPSKRRRSYLSLMAERKAQQRNDMMVQKAPAQKP